MAVKSKKVARKKEGLPKKTAKAKPRASKSVLRHAKAVQIEVVSDFPDLMPPVFVEQISKVRGMISQANDLSDADLAEALVAAEVRHEALGSDRLDWWRFLVAEDRLAQKIIQQPMSRCSKEGAQVAPHSPPNFPDILSDH